MDIPLANTPLGYIEYDINAMHPTKQLHKDSLIEDINTEDALVSLMTPEQTPRLSSPLYIYMYRLLQDHTKSNPVMLKMIPLLFPRTKHHHLLLQRILLPIWMQRTLLKESVSVAFTKTCPPNNSLNSP
jgi:hypothetical protein